MRQSKLFLYTQHNPPADADVPSHRLLGQAGFISKLTAGIYSYAPALWRTLLKITEIVREEMDRAGAQEVMLPILQPRSIWDSSGRWDTYVSDRILFHFQDRKNAEVCLGPTHEEAVTTLVNNFVSSYRQLPVNLYQIQTKFRDEIRPRFGLMRGREFIMKDAYSFDIDERGMDRSYDLMAEAYRNIFRRCGLAFFVAEADSGAIGGSGSQEFIVAAKTGEDLFLINEATRYAANQERARSVIPPYSGRGESPQAMTKVKTPGATTIADLEKFFKGLAADRFLKAVVYRAIFREHEQAVLALVRGDRAVNEVKLKNELGCLALELAENEQVKQLIGAPAGYVGVVGLKTGVTVIADESVREMVNFITGANEPDAHYTNVNFGRDCPAPEFRDIRLAQAGDEVELDAARRKGIPSEQLKLVETRGIEVGHIFKLGTKYSKAMGATFTQEDGTTAPFVMGCYGIGVSRISAAAIEQGHDEKGMIWPMPIAPWQVHLICVNVKLAEQLDAATKLYTALTDAGVEVLFDERDASPGIKFNDADLIGIPLRITVGRDVKEGKVEFLERKDLKGVSKVPVEKVIDQVKQRIAETNPQRLHGNSGATLRGPG